MLMLSGIQHFAFCPRQWALIHIEQAWAENRLTFEGKLVHENVDDPLYQQKSENTIVLRSVSLASKELGLYGISDAIELCRSESKENSILHPKYPGYWEPHPVEYKHGQVKGNETDEVQVAAQTMCLEELYHIKISYGWIYYAQMRHRTKVEISDSLRTLTKSLSDKMHKIYEEQTTPKAILKENCKRCSLYDLCMPKLSKSQNVNSYLKNQIDA